MSNKPCSSGDRSLDVAVVCALELEAGPLVKRLRNRRRTKGNGFVLVEGSLAGRRVGVLRCGTGSKRLSAAADAVLHVHRPRRVIAAGFAVGLCDAVHAGDMVLAQEVTDEQGGRSPADVALPLGDSPAAVHRGRLVSCAAWPRRLEDKRRLGLESGALAADQQSFVLAQCCVGEAVAFSAIRVVVDDLSGNAAPESIAVYHPSRSYRAGGMVGAVLKGTGHARRILELRRAARAHAATLAALLTRALTHL